MSLGWHPALFIKSKTDLFSRTNLWFSLHSISFKMKKKHLCGAHFLMFTSITCFLFSARPLAARALQKSPVSVPNIDSIIPLSN